MATPRYRLKQFAVDNIDRIDWITLSANPNAIHLIVQNPDRINWGRLSSNPNAIHLLEQNPDMVDWVRISRNPSIFKIDYCFYVERYNREKAKLDERYQKIVDNYRDHLQEKTNHEIENLDNFYQKLVDDYRNGLREKTFNEMKKLDEYHQNIVDGYTEYDVKTPDLCVNTHTQLIITTVQCD